MTRIIIRWVLFSGLYGLLALLSLHSRDAWSLSTTLWFPAALLFTVLWLSPICNWPLWLATAGMLHIFASVWTGRPLLLACLFAVFDVLVFPICIVVLRFGMPLLRRPLAHYPIALELSRIALLILCIFCGSALLSATLLLIGYPVVTMHMLSWALAALTSILAILPFLRDHLESPLSLRQALSGWSTSAVIAANVVVQLLFFFTPSGLLPYGITSLFVQLTLLLLSVFMLSGRGVGIMLLAQYLIVVLATQQQEGLFFELTPAKLPAIWQAQWYLVFSAILAGCLQQYQTWIRHQQLQAEGTNVLIRRFAQTGSSVIFRLEMPTSELYWQSSTEAFFPKEHQTIRTLALLEAHCENTFMHYFHDWYKEGVESLFEQELWLQGLDGKRIHCLLVILCITEESFRIGGLSRYPSAINDTLPTTASEVGSPADY